MLPNGLKLFVADIENEEDNKREFWYVVGKTHDSAFKRFTKEANRCWDRYTYHFFEAGGDLVRDFTEDYDDIKAGIYVHWKIDVC